MWYDHVPDSVLENDDYKLLWDFSLPTDNNNYNNNDKKKKRKKKTEEENKRKRRREKKYRSGGYCFLKVYAVYFKKRKHLRVLKRYFLIQKIN